jgi:hypothetical protein
MQLLMNVGDFETFWYFDANGRDGIPATRGLFERLSKPMFSPRAY